MKKTEKQIEALETEQAGILATISENQPGFDYATSNKRLAEIQDKLNFANRRWEAFMIELDELEQERKERSQP